MADSARLAPLTHAVRLPVVARYLGELALLQAGLVLPPAAAGLWYGEHGPALAYGGVALALAAAGWPLARREAPSHIQANEALVVTALAYLLASLALALPIAAAGLAPQDALLEAVSGITTTGLTTLTGLESLPRTLVFARAWAQWCGGLGIVVLSVALLIGHDVTARLLVDSVPGGETLATTTRLFARRISVVYAALTVLGIAALLALGMEASHAVNYTLAAISTGGFAPHDGNLSLLPGWGQAAVVTGLGVLGAVALPLYRAGIRGDRRRVLQDPELRALAAAVALVSAALVLLEDIGPAQAAALAASAQTTTGFTPLTVAALGDDSKLVLIGAMSVGGSVGSTAGGIKLIRLLLVVRLLQLLFRRLCMPPRAVAEPYLGGRRVEDGEALRALGLVLLFMGAAALSWLAFLMAGHPAMDSLFEVVSALATTGLSTGITSAQLAPGLKAVLTADMLLGRIELVALLLLFYPATWFARRTQ